MFAAFFDGASLGLGAAIPIGPVNLLIMSAALISFRSGLVVGFGAITADLIYLGLILFGLFNLSDLMMDIVSFLGALFMFFMAFIIFKNRNNKLKESKFASSSCIKTYMGGFLLTLLSPYTIAFWVSASTFASRHAENAPYMIAGLVVATLGWVVALPFFVYKSRGVLSAKVIKIFATVSAIIMMQIGIRLAASLIQ